MNVTTLENWKDTDINVDSLWLYDERDKTGKHSNIYHGNFIPQIPHQLITRYTQKNEIVLDLFMGSGTTLFECELLNRQFIGFDINTEIIKFVTSQMEHTQIDYAIQNCDVTNSELFSKDIDAALSSMGASSVQFLIAHPPYMDIVKFTELKEDLSQISNVKDFIVAFVKAMQNGLSVLDKGRYFGIVIGDVYKKSEVVPLGFYVLNAIKENFNVKLKGIVVKNIEGNRGKLGASNIWKYRALQSDYFIFKHEYILVFKKEF
jgi:DNA modification methylase